MNMGQHEEALNDDIFWFKKKDVQLLLCGDQTCVVFK